IAGSTRSVRRCSGQVSARSAAPRMATPVVRQASRLMVEMVTHEYPRRMATPDVSTARDGVPAAVLALERVRWTAVLRIMLGALFVSVFFENLNKHLYEAKGYAALINAYRAEGNAPGMWKDFEKLIADHGSLFAPVQAVFEL